MRSSSFPECSSRVNPPICGGGMVGGRGALRDHMAFFIGPRASARGACPPKRAPAWVAGDDLRPPPALPFLVQALVLSSLAACSAQ